MPSRRDTVKFSHTNPSLHMVFSGVTGLCLKYFEAEDKTTWSYSLLWFLVLHQFNTSCIQTVHARDVAHRGFIPWDHDVQTEHPRIISKITMRQRLVGFAGGVRYSKDVRAHWLECDYNPSLAGLVIEI